MEYGHLLQQDYFLNREHVTTGAQIRRLYHAGLSQTDRDRSQCPQPPSPIHSLGVCYHCTPFLSVLISIVWPTFNFSQSSLIYSNTTTARPVTSYLPLPMDNVIQTGLDNPGHPFIKTVGMVAGDEESYRDGSQRPVWSVSFHSELLCLLPIFLELLNLSGI